MLSIEQPIGVLVAVEQEFRAVSSRLTALSLDRIDEFPAAKGRIGSVLVLLIKSGMGPERSQRAAQALIARRPSCLLIAGFAGALDPQLPIGQLVIPERVEHRLSVGYPHSVNVSAISPNPVLWKHSQSNSASPQPSDASLVTHDLVAQAVEQKKKLRLDTGGTAAAVDMESAPAAHVANEAGIPWLVVRVITDRADEDLPLNFGALQGDNGEVDLRRLVAHVLTHPWRIPGLIRLGKQVSLAARNLGDFVERYITSLEFLLHQGQSAAS